jgi:hypothetical protein
MRIKVLMDAETPISAATVIQKESPKTKVASSAMIHDTNLIEIEV